MMATARGGGRDGSALVIVLLALLLVSALAAAMVVLSGSDGLAAMNQRDACVLLHAAEAAVEMGADEVVRIPDWDAVLSGIVRSARVDGPPGGRTLPDGRAVQLEELAHMASCAQAAPCTPAQLAGVSADRPWGANNPRWRLFSHVPSGGGPPALPSYVVTLVADDPAESDGDPQRDGATGSPGAGRLLLRAIAFGPAGSRRTVQATVRRVVAPSGPVAPGFLTWSTTG